MLLNLLASMALMASVGVPCSLAQKEYLDDAPAIVEKLLPSIGSVLDGDGNYYPINPVGQSDEDYYILDVSDSPNAPDLVFPALDSTVDDLEGNFSSIDYYWVEADGQWEYDLLSITQLNFSFIDEHLRYGIFIPDSLTGTLTINLDLTYFSHSGTSNVLYVVRYDDSSADYGVLYGVPFGDGYPSFDVYNEPLYTGDLNPVDAIADGLLAVTDFGTALTNGFDSVFDDNGNITGVASFAFILLGIGISVGICKKCFNWVTGRHGM